MRRVLLVVILSLVGGVADAWAYHGGPDVFTLLGWSAREQRVYWQVEGHNESGEGPAVYYAELGAGKSRTPVRLAWSRGVLDSTAMRRIAALRARLARLPESSGESLPREGTLRVEETGPGSRRIVRGSFRAGYEFEVVSHCRSDVVLRHDYAIPGHPEHLVVVAFVGIADHCEETQEAVLVRPGGRIPRLEYVNRW